MNTLDINALNKRFGAPGRIVFRNDETGLPVVALANQYGTCELSLYGGHVLNYRPTGHMPVLFMSKQSLFQTGKPIRGGIPVCWPWFGPHPADPAQPLHGFARTTTWGLVTTEYSANVTEICLALADTEETRGLWPHRFELTLRVRLDENLNLELTTLNRDHQPLTFTQAFHPYLRVRHISDITVDGLDNALYLNRLNQHHATQTGKLNIRAETDRVYTPHTPECHLHDPGIGRNITLVFAGTKQLVVWNPWIDKARAMPDFADDDYTRMICLEPANTGDGAVTLLPGEKHALSFTLQATFPS